MKLRYVAVICTLASSMSYADICTSPSKDGNSFNGPTSCEKGRISKQMVVNGPLKLEGTSIANTLTINGPLNGQNFKINDLIINGPTTASGSEFKKITAHGPVLLTDSKVDTILMPGPSRYDLEKICLSGKTTVKNIIVKSGKGIIYLQEGAKITGGTPKGAKVVAYDAGEC
ncbi:MAG: hypothetical protein K0R14_160 [Burkholderiales bacterium]|jgi:hypothetical protein|nr:hypothetical protein [Burkholderiales bacterium]